MRAIFTCIVLSMIVFASSERKIIVGSFATEQRAQHALKQFQTKLSTDFLAAQQRLGFDVVARPSGRQFIIAIEPFPSYKEAKKVKKLLPQGYATAFINRYTPPKPVERIATPPSKNIAVEETVAKQQRKEINSTTAPNDYNVSHYEQVKGTVQNNETPTDANQSMKPVVNETVRIPSASSESRYIIDAVTMKLIDATKAYYAVEGQTYGIMSPSGKFAFADKEVAEEFVKQYGGRVVDYATMQQLESKASPQ